MTDESAVVRFVTDEVDPVCVMQVGRTGPTLVVGGTTFWFCADGFRHEYAASTAQGSTDVVGRASSGVCVRSRL